MSDSITKLVSARISLVCGGRHLISNVAGPISALSPTWQRYAVTATAPGNAVTASVIFIGYPSCWATRWDRCVVPQHGAGGSWVPPGVPVPGTYDSTLVLPRNGWGTSSPPRRHHSRMGTGNSYFSESYGTLANSRRRRPRTARVPCRDVHGRLRQSHRGDRADGGNRAAVTAGKYYGVGRGQVGPGVGPVRPDPCTPTHSGGAPPRRHGHRRPSPTPGGRLLTVTSLIPPGHHRHRGREAHHRRCRSRRLHRQGRHLGGLRRAVGAPRNTHRQRDVHRRVGGAARLHLGHGEQPAGR